MKQQTTYLAVGTAGEIQVERIMSGEYCLDITSFTIKHNGATILQLDGENCKQLVQAIVESAEVALENSRQIRKQWLETKKEDLIDKFGEQK